MSSLEGLRETLIAILAPFLRAAALEGSRLRLGAGESCRALLSEPNAPVLRAAGVDALDCGGEARLRLVARNGTWLEARLPIPGCSCSLAELPLYPPAPDYRGPSYRAVSQALQALAGPGESPAVVADAYTPSTGMVCRPRLGCSRPARPPATRPAEEGSRIYSKVYRPRIVQPTMLSWVRRRLARGSRIYRVPWLCVGGGGSYLALVCTPPSEQCRVGVDEKGVLEILEGRGVALDARRCSPTWLYTAYLLGNLLAADGARPNAENPPLWSPTGLIPLYASVRREGRSLELVLLVWNPSPVARRHELVVEGYRLRRALLYTGLQPAWEELIPSFNRVAIPLASLQTALVRIEGVELPPLLRRRGKGGI
ncbi:hypothetical protein CF15_03775 [Pyrodictium occultum]|uniref:NurA domain-containing protein n=1 Tax=Pyrodictium occultum TaxID=2309 RepID=A0A0V8RV41_PYROC|nr:hypothetical protein [Pyrodictium occultum]KSW11924.1 hypothetical protein CF15_03775 [Pyrodictium occultum]